MYSVVGCRECDALWIVEGRPDTTECRRCGTRYSFDRLKQFTTTEDRDAAIATRANLLAERSGHGDSVEDVTAEDVGEVVSDEEYLERQGVDVEEVATVEADERESRSRREIVLAALRELEEPTEGDVIEYATARDVSAAYVRKALSKLRDAGEVSRTNGRYRLL